MVGEKLESCSTGTYIIVQNSYSAHFGIYICIFIVVYGVGGGGTAGWGLGLVNPSAKRVQLTVCQ